MTSPTPSGGWITSFQDSRYAVILDAEFNEVRRIDLGDSGGPLGIRVVAMSPDGLYVATADAAGVRVLDLDGSVIHVLSNARWNSYSGTGCFIDSNGRLWFVRPGTDRGVNDAVVVADPASGDVLAETIFPNDVGYSSFYEAPDGTALIDLGCGQDGVFLYRATLSGSGLTVSQYDFDERTFCDSFSPDGREFVTGAQYGETLCVHRFPDGAVVAQADAEAVFADDALEGPDPDVFGYEAFFVDGSHILTTTRFGRLLLFHRESMQPLATVCPEGFVFWAYDDHGRKTDEPARIIDYQSNVTSVQRAGWNRILVVEEQRCLKLLDLTPLLGQH